MSTRDLVRFRSSRFGRNVYIYRGFVIVPVDAIGSRGGGGRSYEIWSGDQRQRYNRNLRTLADAKALIARERKEQQ